MDRKLSLPDQLSDSEGPKGGSFIYLLLAVAGFICLIVVVSAGALAALNHIGGEDLAKELAILVSALVCLVLAIRGIVKLFIRFMQ